MGLADFYEQQYKYTWIKIINERFDMIPACSADIKVARDNAIYASEQSKIPRIRQQIKEQYIHDCDHYYGKYKSYGGSKSLNLLKQEAESDDKKEKEEELLYLKNEGLL